MAASKSALRKEVPDRVLALACKFQLPCVGRLHASFTFDGLAEITVIILRIFADKKLATSLATVRLDQGRLIGRVEGLGFRTLAAMLAKGILRRGEAGDRSTAYELVPDVSMD